MGAHLDQRVVALDVGELADVGAADRHPRGAATFHAVLQVAGTHEGSGGDHDDAELDPGEHELPEFHLVAEHDDHMVAALDALAPQPVRELGRPFRQFPVGTPRGTAVLLDDDQRGLVSPLRVCGELVKPVEGKVEVLKARPLKFAVGLPVVLAELEQAVAGRPEIVGDCHSPPFAGASLP